MAAVAIGTYLASRHFVWSRLTAGLDACDRQPHGSGRRERIAHQGSQGFWLAGFVSVLVMIVLWNAGYIIRSMYNIDPALADKAVGYLRVTAGRAVMHLLFRQRETSAKLFAKTKTGYGDGILGLLVNIPVNYIFIYGHFGMPELGGIGCGVATAAVYWVMFIAMLSATLNTRCQCVIFVMVNRLWQNPIASRSAWIQLSCRDCAGAVLEVTLFAVAALLVSPLGIVGCRRSSDCA